MRAWDGREQHPFSPRVPGPRPPGEPPAATRGGDGRGPRGPRARAHVRPTSRGPGGGARRDLSLPEGPRALYGGAPQPPGPSVGPLPCDFLILGFKLFIVVVSGGWDYRGLLLSVRCFYISF